MTARPLACMLLSVVAAWLPWQGHATARPQESDAERLSKLKATFVLNFLRYTTWPADRFAAADTPVLVRVMSDARVARNLELLSRSEKIEGRTMVVEALAYPAANAAPEDVAAFTRMLREAHAVFVGADQANRVGEIMRMVEDGPVLMIGDTPGFAAAGGMLGLAIRDNRLAFDANPDAITAAELAVSSKVLRLARIVKSQERAP